MLIFSFEEFKIKNNIENKAISNIKIEDIGRDIIFNTIKNSNEISKTR